MTDYRSFVKFDFINILSRYNNRPSTRSGECSRKFEYCRCGHWRHHFI